MKISGFTIVRNGIRLRYPFVEAIRSILPLCDEFIVNVGQGDDATLKAIQDIRSPKIKVIQTVWDMGQKAEVLSQQTNLALSHCTGDWAFYLQSDEVVHEADLPKLKICMAGYLNDPRVDVLRFKWLHFFGSHYRYRIDRGWYQKQDRIIRNNGSIESFGDAFAFRRKDGQPLRSAATGCFIYHYGWTNNEEEMRRRYQNATAIGYGDKAKDPILAAGYGDLNRFPIYFGSHPKAMAPVIAANPLSQSDWQNIAKRHRFNPLRWLKPRFKTGRRVKESIN